MNINDDTLLIGTSELRTNMPKISKEIKNKKIILVKRGKPFAVLSDYEEYNKKEELLDNFEDLVLGLLAKEREENSSDKNYITLEEVEKKLGI